MPTQFHDQLPPQTLTPQGTGYAFYTNEKGSSTSCGIGGEPTRSVNLYNPHDTPSVILDNLKACIDEVPGITRSFYLTSNYAAGGAKLNVIDPEARDLSISREADFRTTRANLQEMVTHLQEPENLESLSLTDAQGLFDRAMEGVNPEGVKPDELKARFKSLIDQRKVLKNALAGKDREHTGLYAVKADAIIVKRTLDEDILIGGPSADAHPLVIIGKHAIAYMAGAHATINAGVLEKTLKTMFETLGEKPEDVRIVVGPGLGSNSYEFGANAPELFKLTNLDRTPVDLEAGPHPHLKKVSNAKGESKYLVNMANMVRYRAGTLGVPEANVFDMEIDTMGVDLYLPDGTPNPAAQSTDPIAREMFLWFGARRKAKIVADDMEAHEPGKHILEGRHFAGVFIRGDKEFFEPTYNPQVEITSEGWTCTV